MVPNLRPMRCPKLTDDELRLLNKHKGCRKCRKFYVAHTKVDCPNDWPDPMTYRPLTLEMAQAVMAVTAAASVSSGLRQGSMQGLRYHCDTSSIPSNSDWIAASSSYPSVPDSFSGVGGYMAPTALSYSTPAPMVHSPVFLEDTNGSGTEHAVNSNTALAMASVNAVLPSTSLNFVLDDDSPTGENNVSLGPIITPHLMWHANIWGKDEFQVVINCMIDDGSQLVLIRPELVTTLGLLIRQLHKPIRVTLALSGKNTVTKCILANFVSLQLFSINNA